MSLGVDHVDVVDSVQQAAASEQQKSPFTPLAQRQREVWEQSRRELEAANMGLDPDEPEGDQGQDEQVSGGGSDAPSVSLSSPSPASGGGTPPPPEVISDPVRDAILARMASPDPDVRRKALRALQAYEGEVADAPSAPAAPVQPPPPQKSFEDRVKERFEAKIEGLKNAPENKFTRLVRRPDPDADSFDKMIEEKEEGYHQNPDDPMIRRLMYLEAQNEETLQELKTTRETEQRTRQEQEAQKVVRYHAQVMSDVTRRGVPVGVEGKTSADWFKDQAGQYDPARAALFDSYLRSIISDQGGFSARVQQAVMAGNAQPPQDAIESLRLATRFAFDDFSRVVSPYGAQAAGKPAAPAAAPQTPKNGQQPNQAKIPSKGLGAPAGLPSQPGQGNPPAAGMRKPLGAHGSKYSDLIAETIAEVESGAI